MGGTIIYKKKAIISVCIGIGIAAAVLVIGSLLRSLIRNITFAEAIGTSYLWYVSAVVGIGSSTAFFRKGQK